MENRITKILDKFGKTYKAGKYKINNFLMSSIEYDSDIKEEDECIIFSVVINDVETDYNQLTYKRAKAGENVYYIIVKIFDKDLDLVECKRLNAQFKEEENSIMTLDGMCDWILESLNEIQ